MCGIAGIYSFQFSAEVNVVKQMTDILAHRGPDGEGHWKSHNNKVAFGHRRLSIVDLSANGNQPMHYLNRYTITYNGEIYNFKALRNSLEKKGYSFFSKTDTEVILALYDLKKENCLSDLDGMFAFAIWDDKEQTLFCARDRFGEKPFYYHTNQIQFIFASEIKALLAVGVEKKVNHSRLINYLSSNAIEDPFDKSTTFYENIIALEASHYLIIRQNKIIKKKYYQLSYNINNSISFDEAKEEFKLLMKDSVKARTLNADVNVGTSLSGGVDSSIIFHEINQISKNINSYTASFPGFEKDESNLVRLLHQNYQANAYFVYPDAEMYLKDFDKLFYHQDEPMMNANIHAQFTVFRLAKEHHTTVLLDGQGADEIFAGYHLYFKPYLQELLRASISKFKKEVIKYKHSNHLFLNRSFYFEAFFPKLFHKYSQLRKHYQGNLIDLNKDFFNQYQNKLFDKKYLEPKLNEHLHFNLFYSGFEHLLRYGDRSSMAHSREVRLPFLCHKIVEFAASLPLSYKINEGYAKYIERASYNNIIPNDIIWKKEKIGYEAPQSQWLNNNKIQEKINDAIQVLTKEKIINPNKVDQTKWWRYMQTAKLLEK